MDTYKEISKLDTPLLVTNPYCGSMDSRHWILSTERDEILRRRGSLKNPTKQEVDLRDTSKLSIPVSMLEEHKNENVVSLMSKLNPWRNK